MDEPDSDRVKMECMLVVVDGARHKHSQLAAKHHNDASDAMTGDERERQLRRSSYHNAVADILKVLHNDMKEIAES